VRWMMVQWDEFNAAVPAGCRADRSGGEGLTASHRSEPVRLSRAVFNNKASLERFPSVSYGRTKSLTKMQNV